MLRCPERSGLENFSSESWARCSWRSCRNCCRTGTGFQLPSAQAPLFYKETIRRPAEGWGILSLCAITRKSTCCWSPGSREAVCRWRAGAGKTMLDGNWQRQILKNLEEKHHRGVLAGSEITDMRLILIAGRSHEKHTEGGDFREAAWRAVRQGLMSAESILLEPVYQFRLDLPAETWGGPCRICSGWRKYGAAGKPWQPGDAERDCSCGLSCGLSGGTSGVYQRTGGVSPAPFGDMSPAAIRRKS